MNNLLFLLLPIAAFSGWHVGRKQARSTEVKKKKTGLSPKYFTGLNYLLNEQPDKAVDIFLQLLDIDDDMLELHFTLGKYFRQRGEFERAIKIHEALLSRDDLSANYQELTSLELAKDYYYAGMLDRAENILLDLINSGCKEEQSFEYLLEIYQQGKDWQAAINTAEKLHSISHKDYSQLIAQFYCELSEQAINARQLQQARKFAKSSKATNKSCVRAYIAQADIEQHLGNYKAALRLYQEVAEKFQGFFCEVGTKIAKCYETIDQKEAMVKYFIDNLDVYTMAKLPSYKCENCGFCAPKLLWHCPSCKQWEKIKPLLVD